MHDGNTENVATRHPGGAADLEAPASRMTRRTRPGGNVRIARVDRQRRPTGCAGNAPSDLPEAGSQGARIRLQVRGRRVIVVDESAIECVDGAGNYVRIHVGAAKYQVRGTLNEVEAVLAGAGQHFVRVHRSTILNLRLVREFERTPYGDLIAVLRGGQRLTVGRVYLGKVRGAARDQAVRSVDRRWGSSESKKVT
jgi:DNA-binding LytR/AlgR family response regulator